MNPETSPFTPGVPASADIFTGREEHVKELLVAVRAAKRGKLSVAWIGGERGVGKSSLAAYVGAVAEQNENTLFAHVPLGDAVTVKGIAKKAYLSLLDNNRDKTPGEKLFALFGERVRKIGVYGLQLELAMKPNELPESLDGLANELAGIAKKSGAKAMTLVFDDINGIAGKPFFAHGIKSMVDGLAIRKAHVPVCMIFTGLDERLEDMRDANPSIVRCFRPMLRVEPWTHKESCEFFLGAFKRASASIGDGNVKLLANYCGGIPTVAHEIGDAVWRAAKNKNIKEMMDIATGVRMAMLSIGGRFLQRNIVDARQSRMDISILGKIAAKNPPLFSREDLLAGKLLTSEEKENVDDFLRRMRNLGGILTVGDTPGAYRFPSYIHRIYFLNEAGKAVA